MCLVNGVAVPTVVLTDVALGYSSGVVSCVFLYAVNYNDFFIIIIIALRYKLTQRLIRCLPTT